MNISDISSLFDNKKLTLDEYKSRIYNLILSILKNRFPESIQKQRIIIHSNRFQFSCPCCGDSMHDLNKKRGNFIFDGNFKNSYKCFNCGTFLSAEDFLKKYSTSQLELPIIEYISENKINYNSNLEKIENINFDIFDNNKINSYAIPRDYFKSKLNLKEVNIINSVPYNYLVGRNQFNFNKFLYDEENNNLYILNLTLENKIMGIQIKPLNTFLSKSFSKYKTYLLSNLYKDFLHEEKEIPEDINSLSTLFNICLINFNKPIILTEGPLDAFLINNGIASCGISRKIPIDLNFWYLYDDDKVGREYALKKIKENKYVFLWSLIKEKYNQYITNENKKLDVNDLVNLSVKFKLEKPDFSNLKYWSNDYMDSIYI